MASANTAAAAVALAAAASDSMVSGVPLARRNDSNELESVSSPIVTVSGGSACPGATNANSSRRSRTAAGA